jgi:monoterpene epsilon-lactone hydrolase
MPDAQLLALNRALAASPLDVGGDLAVQRPLFEEAYSPPTSVPADLAVETSIVDGVPVVSVDLADGSTRGVILLAHGGAFAIGTAAGSIGMAISLVRAARMRVVSVDYRLAPEHPFPAGRDDVRTVHGALTRGGVRPEDISLWGISAGGALALGVAVDLVADGERPPGSVVLLSPWLDLSLAGGSMDGKAEVDLIITREGLVPRVRDYLGDGDPEDPAVSPLFADLRGLPPILVQAGSAETLLDDALRLAARAAHVDVTVTLDVTAGAPHVFPSAADVYDEGAAALDRACRFARDRADRPVA